MAAMLKIRDDIADALGEGAPVVALESTVIAQGLPYPLNLETARRMEEAVRKAGALPATIGLRAGVPVIGLSEEELAYFAEARTIEKLSARDLGGAVARKADGATTVAGTLALAHLAKIEVFATGGIGGVHRGAAHSFDISADIIELSRRPLLVVSAGAKAILDLPATLEVLESQGVAVAGYRTSDFPAFYSRTSGLELTQRLENPGQAAAAFLAQRALGQEGALLLANPIPEDAELSDCEVLIAQAVREADERGIAGKAVTPFLLSRLAELSEGRTLRANAALLVDNATLAGVIAVALKDGKQAPHR